MSKQWKQEAARALFDYDCEDMSEGWREMAWEDMGGSERSQERVDYELRAEALAPVVAREVSRAKAEALAPIREIHAPMDALNVRNNQMQKVCTGCGTDEGNWMLWPCPTIRAIGPEVVSR